MIAKRLASLLISVIVAGLLLTLLFQVSFASTDAGAANGQSLSAPLDPELYSAVPSLQPAVVPTIEVRARTGITVVYHANNRPDNPVIPMPRLVLSQTDSWSDEVSRTVDITVTDVQVNPGVTETIAILVMTQNGDPDLGGGIGNRINVWRDVQTRSVPITGTAQTFDVAFSHVFTESILYGGGPVRTPTGYFRVRARLGAGAAIDYDYAFLMDNEYRRHLGTANGNDYDMLIRYYDMSPYGYDNNVGNWIPRALVPTHIVNDFVPLVRRVFTTTVNDWGMPPLNQDWRGPSRLLTIDINEDEEWYHTEAGANSSIHLKSYPPVGGWTGYPDVISRQEATFYHELFHNMQHSISIDDFGVRGPAWDFVNEGTAVLATAVGQPMLQFDAITNTHPSRQHRAFSNRFINSHLNRSYATISNTQNFHYSTALYWRFLYERGTLN